jgi:tricorn protease
MDAVWSPDGKSIAYLSDRDGDYEIYIAPAEVAAQGKKLTSNAKSWRFPPLWSPDSKLLAYADKDHMPHVVDVATGKVTSVDKDDYGDITDYRWSPDSKWLVYTKNNEARYSAIWVWSLADGKASRLTSGMTNDGNPVFDPKGRYLYFTSNRDFNLTFSAFEFNYVYTDPTRVYVGVLAADGPALLLPQSDEEKPAPATPAPAPEKKKDHKAPGGG